MDDISTAQAELDAIETDLSQAIETAEQPQRYIDPEGPPVMQVVKELKSKRERAKAKLAEARAAARDKAREAKFMRDPEYAAAIAERERIDVEYSELMDQQRSLEGRRYLDDATITEMNDVRRRRREIEAERMNVRARIGEAKRSAMVNAGREHEQEYRALVRRHTLALLASTETVDALRDFEAALPGRLQDCGLGSPLPLVLRPVEPSNTAWMDLLICALRLKAIKLGEIPKDVRHIVREKA